MHLSSSGGCGHSSVIAWISLRWHSYLSTAFLHREGVSVSWWKGMDKGQIDRKSRYLPGANGYDPADLTTSSIIMYVLRMWRKVKVRCVCAYLYMYFVRTSYLLLYYFPSRIIEHRLNGRQTGIWSQGVSVGCIWKQGVCTSLSLSQTPMDWFQDANILL